MLLKYICTPFFNNFSFSDRRMVYLVGTRQEGSARGDQGLNRAFFLSNALLGNRTFVTLAPATRADFCCTFYIFLGTLFIIEDKLM